MSNPSSEWRFITSYSTSVSRLGLLRIASGTPILPTSCSRPARRMRDRRSPSKPSSVAMTAHNCETVWQWLRV